MKWQVLWYLQCPVSHRSKHVLDLAITAKVHRLRFTIMGIFRSKVTFSIERAKVDDLKDGFEFGLELVKQRQGRRTEEAVVHMNPQDEEVAVAKVLAP